MQHRGELSCSEGLIRERVRSGRERDLYEKLIAVFITAS